MTDPRKPNIIGVGMGRCGTRSLFKLLGQSGKVFLSKKKETAYFNRYYESWSFQEYLSLFEGGENFPFRCEITPSYLNSRLARKRIHEKLSEANIVIQVREPVSRVVSDFYNRGGTEKFGDINIFFREGLSSIKEKGLDNFFPYEHPARMIQRSIYVPSIREWSKKFPSKRIHLISLDDVIERPKTAYSSLSKLLGVDLSESLHENKIRRDQQLDSSIQNELEKLFAKDWTITRQLIKDLDFSKL
jgi:hypothetical protein